MLIVFKSKAAADVLMYTVHVKAVMTVAGRDYHDHLPERGVITHEQLGDFIKSLEDAVTADKNENPDDANQEYKDQEDKKPHPISEPVSFRQRVWPLLNLLRLSNDKQVDVMWEPASEW